MKVETSTGLEKRLREVGYSDGAITEILKWYKQNNIDIET